MLVSVAIQSGKDQVVIAVDPHKAAWTAAAVDASLQPLASIRVPVSRDGYRALRRFARQWPNAGMEGPGYWSNLPPHDRVGLWRGVYSGLRSRKIPVAVIASATRAKWAIGRVDFKKRGVLDVVVRGPIGISVVVDIR